MGVPPHAIWISPMGTSRRSSRKRPKWYPTAEKSATDSGPHGVHDFPQRSSKGNSETLCMAWNRRIRGCLAAAISVSCGAAHCTGHSMFDWPAATHTSPTRTSWRTISLARSEEHTSELQSPCNLVSRVLLEKKVKATRMADASKYASVKGAGVGGAVLY